MSLNDWWRRFLSSPPKVTISAFTETGQEESSIIVPLQRSYTGKRVISSRLADTPCTTFSLQGFLDQLNTTFGTTYSLDNPSLSRFLKARITSRYDFGLIYGLLRRIWYTDDWSTVRDKLCREEEEDRERRREALDGNRIVDTELRPRRVWDLYSNRVVPRWFMDLHSDDKLWLRPISHAWMDEKDRALVWTPINGYEWPVPIPKDANLNLIRIEMLNLGLEYAWLDVLCLRQVGGPGEDLRAEEWKVDVPTIGRVYQDVEVACYLSGLGRPLTLKEGDLESDRSWFRRAWTLQEIGSKRVIAGDTPDGPLHAKWKYGTELLIRFHKQLESVDTVSYSLFEALEEMQKRVSTNPVDKIAGLAFLMGTNVIPAYYESESLEEAWTALVNEMDAQHRRVLLLCAEPGNAGKKWRPSWNQVMTKPLPAFFEYCPDVHWDEEEDKDWCDADCIEGLVLGLAVVKKGDRRGVLIAKDKGGIEHRFEITATHTSPIPEDTYEMIHTCIFQSSGDHGWMVGRCLPGGKFEKVSMLIISDEKYWRLWKLDLIKEKCRHILI
ncbi:hypothetical protein ARMGADRAFT_1072558 [Armillaria gallica]|uniref:Heterokaryon incompatibility domain-containing protein n=1 Tax=Armillaria gallica TaxID=47427 RepID=A0A2H3E1J8_ARMGA|nr:hypothetical protein ARMGADRAFT_1072558 [Armillaria gallica]